MTPAEVESLWQDGVVVRDERALECGPFSIASEGEVIHHLKLCSFEDWVGTDQHRFAELEGDTLTLSSAPGPLRGKQGVGRLVWKRVTT